MSPWKHSIFFQISSRKAFTFLRYLSLQGQLSISFIATKWFDLALDVKSLYTNDQVSEAIEVALQCLYTSDTPPDIERSTFKLLLKLAVTKVYFKSNGNWYC